MVGEKTQISSAGSWLITRSPFTSQVVSKAGSPGRIQDAAGHTLPTGFLLPCLPRKGPSLPYGLSRAGISQAAGWRILSPCPLQGHSTSCKPGLHAAGARVSRHKDTLPCHLLTFLLGLAGTWNGNVSPLLCPGPEPQMEVMLLPMRDWLRAVSVGKMAHMPSPNDCQRCCAAGGAGQLTHRL